MDWTEALRRIASGEDVTNVLDQKNAEDRADLRAFLADQRHAVALAHYDAAMRDLDTGVMGARSTWHSISAAQRKVLLAVVKSRTGLIRRRYVKPSFYVLDGKADLLCRIATLRNLADRDLVAWDGGAFDPEASAVITERGRFVVRHGQPQEAPNA